jgi:hypothetical protein
LNVTLFLDAAICTEISDVLSPPASTIKKINCVTVNGKITLSDKSEGMWKSEVLEGLRKTWKTIFDIPAFFRTWKL